MDARYSEKFILEKLKSEGIFRQDHKLLIQVGSTVLFPNSGICSDIDLILISSYHENIGRLGKRIIGSTKTPDIEVSEFPLCLPSILEANSQLNFFLFRERKKIENSVLLWGKMDTYKEMVMQLKGLPLPLQELKKILKDVDPHSKSTKCQINNFFTLVTLLGYTEFRFGPVKPKWMLRELVDHSRTEFSSRLERMLNPFVEYGISRLTTDLSVDKKFLEYWNKRGTAWEDALFLTRYNSNSSALVIIYCTHCYVRSIRGKDSGEATNVYEFIVKTLDESKHSLKDLTITMYESVERALL